MIAWYVIHEEVTHLSLDLCTAMSTCSHDSSHDSSTRSCMRPHLRYSWRPDSAPQVW